VIVIPTISPLKKMRDSAEMREGIRIKMKEERDVMKRRR
jgi:hypothetical protein